MALSQGKYLLNQMKNNVNHKNEFVKVINTKKYKDINLYLRFSVENKKQMKEKVSLLCKLIGETSNNYSTKSEMAYAKDMLYGFSCAVSNKVRGNTIILTMHCNFVNPKYVDASIDEYNSFIKEILYNSIINDETVDEAKRTVKASLLRRIEKPINKANERFIEIVSNDNPAFSIYGCNEKFINSIDKIKTADLLDTYRFIINKAQLNVYLCGDFENEDDIRILTTFNYNNRQLVTNNVKKLKCRKKKNVVDKMKISQTYLSCVYSTPFNKKHKDYFAWFVGNAFFGAAPTSLLFSEVREKMSLCYAISAIDYKTEGLVKVSTSIDGKNKDRVIKEIDKQINRLINKDYDVAMLEATKSLLANSIISLYDNLDDLIDYYHEQVLSGFDYTIEEYCENVMKVTPNDISRVFKKYEHYFNYILLGTGR